MGNSAKFWLGRQDDFDKKRWAILMPFGLWFYQQVNIKNVHKGWVKRIIKKRSSARITKAIEYLNRLDELKAVKTGANL